MALDAGTTSNRCILFDQKGQIVSLAQKEFTQRFPKPGWVEHDANEIWSTMLGVAVEAMQKAGASYEDIAAIGITNQRETTIVWDKKTGEPVYNAIVWQCRRTSEYCDSLMERGLVDRFREKTGLVIDAYFSATKLKWILDEVPGVRERAERGDLYFGTVETWLIWKLTKGAVHVTDYSNASRTLLFNINTLDWDEDILKELNIPRCMLPKPMPSSCVYGCADPAFFWRKDSHRWSGRRPAVCIVRTDLFYTGRCKKHLWNRLFSVDEHRRRAGIFGKWAGYNHRLGNQWESLLCTGRIHFCGWSCDTVAAR